MRLKYLAGAVVLPLFLVGCGGNSYDVEGTVKYRQLDYDCKKVTAVGFMSASSSGGSGGKGSPRKGSSGSKAPVAVPVPDTSPTKAVKPVGASCKTEYELFIENDDGLFEQDVTSDHYEKCIEKKRFPDCAE